MTARPKSSRPNNTHFYKVRGSETIASLMEMYKRNPSQRERTKKKEPKVKSLSRLITDLNSRVVGTSQAILVVKQKLKEYYKIKGRTNVL